LNALSERPIPTAVLHDVVLQGQLSLARPRASLASTSAMAPASPVSPAAVTARPGAAMSDTAQPARTTQATQAVLDEARRQGYEEGFAKGAAEARAQSAEEARQLATRTAERSARESQECAQRMALELTETSNAQARAQREALDALLSALPDQIEARLEAVQDDMLELCFETVCRVLGDAAVQPDAVRAHLRHAAQGLRGRRLVAIHLHPDDLAAARHEATDSGAEQLASGEIQWVADPTIVSGGCILQSPQGGLDARFDSQLRALRDMLLRSRALVRPEA
jgi:flagellar assembly protein FliH